MSRIIVWAGILPVLLAGFAHAEDPVHFTDGNLKALVEETLWVTNPTPADMLGLTRLFADAKGIRSLTGLEYAENLTTLQLTHNEISSLSALSGLTNLHTLVLNNNKISGVSALAGLSHLRMLDLHDNEITDISGLSNLTNLESLILRYNKISSISALASLSRLRFVALQYNQISSISALANLTSLTNLNLRANPLNVEACSTIIPQILANNPDLDLTYDPCAEHQIEICSTIGGSVIAPGEGEFAFENGETVFLEAQADPGYQFVNFSGCAFTEQNPASIVIRQSGRIQANFVCVLDHIFVDDDAIDDPGPGDAGISDPQEDGTEQHPFDAIQEAINSALDGITIVVRPGTYYENIDLLGKCIQLLGIDSSEPVYPVVDGGRTGSVVRFTRGEDPNCMLMGFVITGGTGDQAGAIYCNGSSPTIANCLIAGNRATDADGAAVACYHSNAILVNCTIADNQGGFEGGGIALTDSDVALLNCIIWGNSPQEMCLIGSSEPLVAYTALPGGWSAPGNIDSDPLFARSGYWQQIDDGTLVPQTDDSNVWIEGDYHLRSQTGRWDPTSKIWVVDPISSPCIDAGNPDSSVGAEPQPNGAWVNMGAYGATTQGSMSP